MAATFKVAVLIVKALVKPLAAVLKKNAVEPSWFRSLCMNYGQFHNKTMTHIQLRSLGHKAIKIKPLPEDEAVKLGADIFAEGMVLGTGLLAIGAEVYRKTKADEAAERKKEEMVIEEKKKHELLLLERENQLRRKLVMLEERMISMENAKITQLHDKLVKEQLKHVAFSETLLERIEALENMLAIHHEQQPSPETLDAPRKVVIVEQSLPEHIIASKPPALDEVLGSVEEAVKGEMEAEERVPAVLREKEEKEKKEKEEKEREKAKEKETGKSATTTTSAAAPPTESSGSTDSNTDAVMPNLPVVSLHTHTQPRDALSRLYPAADIAFITNMSAPREEEKTNVGMGTEELKTIVSATPAQIAQLLSLMEQLAKVSNSSRATGTAA